MESERALDAVEEFLAATHKLEVVLAEEGFQVPEMVTAFRRHFQSQVLLARSTSEC